jgi:hydroxypyruvate reductase
MALNAAREKAVELGYETQIVTDDLSGLAEDAAREWVRKVVPESAKNTCFIAGGETTVKVRGTGKGGRNQQFALAAAIALKGSNDVTLLAGGTDGSDGPTDAAGAIVISQTIHDAIEKGLDAETYLYNNDAYHFFDKIDGLLKTGPTNTNVMDIVITLL